jgi:hypothetical protein
MATIQTATAGAPAENKVPAPARRYPILDTLAETRGNPAHDEKAVNILVRQLQEGDLTARSAACVGIRNLAKVSPDDAKKAIPALMEAFSAWGPLTKCVVAETLGTLIDISGSHVGIVNAGSLRVLINAANGARHPEVRERVVDVIRKIIPPAPLATQLEEAGSETKI